MSDDGFDALMRARPDVAESLFGDAQPGQEAETDVGTVADLLADDDGVGSALDVLSMPMVQVLMALVGHEAAGTGGSTGPDELLESLLGSGGRGSLAHVDTHVLRRLMGRFGDAFGLTRYADVDAARETLCKTLPRGKRSKGEREFDRCVAELTTACLVWPEQDRLRLHDALPALLPEAGSDWDGFALVQPVVVGSVAVSADSIAAEAAAAAAGALRETERFFGCVAAEPVSLLKAGGVGARELKRMAKVTGIGEDRLRFWLHVGYHGDLLTDVDGRLLATPRYDQWVAAGPPNRFALLFSAWVAMYALPLDAWTDDAGRRPAPVAEASFVAYAPILRSAVLDLLAELPEGVQADADSLADALRWRAPLAFADDMELADHVCTECGPRLGHGDVSQPVQNARAVAATIVAEGSLLGVLAHGSATELIRIIVRGTVGATGPQEMTGELARAIGSMVPTALDKVRIQGDLTAVAPGLPSPRLSALFDTSAVRESSGVATVWRFTDGSIRRWLDQGGTADELLDRLSEHNTGSIPQALHYMITDAGRRHGLVDVIGTRAVVVTADHVLGEELAAHPALARLAARRVAPTVLVSDTPPAEVLEALRFAGYMPSAHQADGTITVSTLPQQRAGAVAWS